MLKLGLVAGGMLLAMAGGASAQYYPPPDYPPPAYPPPAYAPPVYPQPAYPPPAYPPPGYYRPPRAELGFRCDARLPTGYGAAPLICDIVRPRPVGRPCSCPPPPGYPRGELFGGRVIP